ncbi:MAG: AAA family ATPase [Proteobacteria bacterium]|nr:MAG: AAA family ATPase [Pseudomonadota bacterium]
MVQTKSMILGKLKVRLSKKSLPVELRRRVGDMVKNIERMLKETEFDNHDNIRNNIDLLEKIANIPFEASAHVPRSAQSIEKSLQSELTLNQATVRRVMQHLSPMSVPSVLPKVLPLYINGPTGSGKSSLAQAIAKSLGWPSVTIDGFEFLSDENLHGNPTEFQISRFSEVLRSSKSSQCVIIIEDFDNLLEEGGSRLAHFFKNLLKTQSSRKFYDRTLQAEIDLSQTLFIMTGNSEQSVLPKAISERISSIYLPAMQISEKTEIAQHCFIPRLRQELGLKARQLRLEREVISYIVETYSRYYGLSHLYAILRRVAEAMTYEQLTQHPRTTSIKQSEIDTWLSDLPTFSCQDMAGIELPGTAVALYGSEDDDNLPGWATGGIFIIELGIKPNKDGPGQYLIRSTGNLDIEILESVQTAMSYIMINTERYGLDVSVLRQSELHIHIREAGSEKAGTSMGLMLTLGLFSLLLKRPLPQDLTGTGEVSLHGRVLEVGMLDRKLRGAYDHKLKRVMMPTPPRDNIAAYQWPKELKRAMQVIYVASIDEALAVTWPDRFPAQSRTKRIA